MRSHTDNYLGFLSPHLRNDTCIYLGGQGNGDILMADRQWSPK